MVAHRVSVAVQGRQIDGWLSYRIGSSMLEAVDHFTLARPFDPAAYRLCQLDAEIAVRIDDVAVVTGRIDTRDKDSDRGTATFVIAGRDRMARIVQESAPTIAYDGLDFVTVVKLLAAPWFTTVVLSDARNRTVRLGRKGRKAAAAAEALVVKVRKKTWQHEPGQTRWKIMNDLASEAGYMIWSSADGKELIIGQPNYRQSAQYVISQPDPQSASPTTALKLGFKESIADRFSLIMALGSGRGDAANYGASTVSRRDIVRNGPGIDGTGVDFDAPKRLILAERTLLNAEEAHQFAQREMDRRDFHRHLATATMPGHGQATGGAPVSLYAPNTIAHVIDDEQDPPIDGRYLIYSAEYEGARETETTSLQLAPSGTVFVQ